jgi:hypothetical protein
MKARSNPGLVQVRCPDGGELAQAVSVNCDGWLLIPAITAASWLGEPISWRCSEASSLRVSCAGPPQALLEQTLGGTHGVR